MAANSSSPDTIVFIHGLYLTARSWELWEKRYTDRGYKVINQSWPGLEGEVEALRRDPMPIATLTVQKILDHYERIIEGLERPPIIIGHSFGGAFTQVLLSRGLGSAGVGLAAGTVRGVLDVPLITLRSNWKALRNPIFRHRAIMPSAKEFRFAFTNTFTEEDSAKAYERYAIAASRNVLFTGVNANVNPFTPLKVDFKKSDRAPLLFIAGGKDHVVPASANRHNAAKYRKSQAITDIVEFPERPHFIAVQERWEEVADYALQWALNPVTELTAASATALQRVSPVSSSA
jgi:pimeloyl-ACP methyl ester carboxylesterase